MMGDEVGISTETRELAIAPVREGLMELIAEKRPQEAAALREFASAYLRRLSADAAESMSAEELFAEVAGAFDFAATRCEHPIVVRAFNPTRSEHGYERAGSVLETNTEDLPFLVDSVRAELVAQGIGVQRVLHPVVGFERDEAGRIQRVLHPREASARESVMHFDLDRRLDDAALEALAESVRAVLGDVRRAVLDFPAMTDRGRRMVQIAGAGAARYADDEVDETVAFLEWLLQDHFIFLGYREYRIDEESIGVVPGSGLGILADEASSRFARAQPLAELPADVRERALEGDLLIVSKTNRLSTVHRHARMDYVGVRRVSADGRISGEARMLGLFTTKAYAEPASQTPLLNRKLRQILRHEDLIEGSHDYKAAVSLFDSFPKDELFSARTDDLRRAVVALLSLEGDQRAAAGPRLGRRPLGLADRRAARGALRRRAAGRADGAAARALRHRGDRHPHGARRGRPRARARHRARARRRARRVAARARAGADRAHAHLGGRRARAAGRALRPGPRARARRTLGPALPASTTAPRSIPRWWSATSSSSTGSSASTSRSSSACRTSRDARASRSTRPAARSSWATRCRRSRTSACASSRRSRRACSAATARPGCRTSACSGRATARSTWPRRESASPTASPPCGAATPSPTRSTGSCSSPGSTGARSTSCAPTGCTASGSARASRRATRTTCWRPTRS